MKRIIGATLISMVVFLTACSNKTQDPYKSYRKLTSAQLIKRSETALTKEQYSAAINNLEALDAVYPFGPNARQAQLNLIYAYYKHEDLASALVEAERFIRLYPRDRVTSYAYYMRGRIEFDLGQSWVQRKLGVNPAERDLRYKKQAFLSFSQVVRFYPKSIYAYDASLRMRYIRNLLAEKQLILAQYYLERHAYVAAVNRASFVVQHFDGAPQVLEALPILAKAYGALGLQDLANDANRVLEANISK